MPAFLFPPERGFQKPNGKGDKMRDIADIVHEITVAVLPKTLEEAGIPCVIKTEDGFRYNAEEIVKVYDQLYFKIENEYRI